MIYPIVPFLPYFCHLAYHFWIYLDAHDGSLLQGRRRLQREGSQIVETSSYVYVGRSMNMENDLKEELNRRMRAAWAAFAPVKEATDKLTNQDLRPHLFDSAVLPALCYAAETWGDTAATSRKLLTTHRALER
ncbi:hypothetical protein RB195_002899 [Necator americanus]|uniref:Uncharacterized protein n=1 Tax=Necator americanus TaxID=51031 RepID=A0ABR1DMJ3_NECAM